MTALKGLFILVIVFHNTLNVNTLFQTVPGTSFVRLFGGDLGNTMFFILSGFLMSYSYRERICGGMISFQAFLRRRLKKLYPMYLITNAVSLILAVIRYGPSAVNLKKIAFTILLQMGSLDQGVPYNSPTWFVSALFACYILYFFIALYAKKPTQYDFAIVIGIVWGYMLTDANLSIPFCYPGNGLAFMCFFIGCGLAELYPLLNQKIHRWLRPTSFLVVAASFFLLFRYGVDIISGGFCVACGFLLCPLILYLALADGLCTKILKLKPLLWLGNISVSLYFWHFVVYNLMVLLVPGRQMCATAYTLYIPILVVWSAVSYRLFEMGQRHSVSVSAK